MPAGKPCGKFSANWIGPRFGLTRLVEKANKDSVPAHNARSMVLGTVGLSIDSGEPNAQNAPLTVDTAAKTL